MSERDELYARRGHDHWLTWLTLLFLSFLISWAAGEIAALRDRLDALEHHEEPK